MQIHVKDVPMLSGFEQAYIDEQDWVTLTQCPICESDKHVVEVGIVKGERGKVGAVTSLCTACEYRFLTRRPSEAWFTRFYAADWDQVGQQSLQSSTKQIIARDKILQFCRSHLPAGGKVIDIGAGYGRDILAFQQAGYDVHAIEASEHRAQFIEAQLGISCYALPLNHLAMDQTFDLVYSYHVFEHLTNPDASIQSFVKLLNPNGYLYIAVPNFWQEYMPQAMHFVPHISAFTLHTMQCLFAKYHLKLIAHQLDRELQVLAQYVPQEEQQIPANDPQNFLARFEEYACNEWAQGTGYQTLIWHADSRPDVVYPRYQFRSSIWYPRLIPQLKKVIPYLPGRLRRRLPPYIFRDNLRILGIDVKSPQGLPISVAYPSPDAPVWVK